jgi:hypothetical protein
MVHGDLKLGNMGLAEDGSLTAFDWEETFPELKDTKLLSYYSHVKLCLTLRLVCTQQVLFSENSVEAQYIKTEKTLKQFMT